MANFPVYQRHERLQYPDPKTMVVDWASAVDKVMQGFVKGIENREERKRWERLQSAADETRAQNIEESQHRIKLASEEAARAEQRLAMELAQHELRQKTLNAEFNMKYSEAALDVDAQTKRQQLEKLYRSNNASQVLNMHTDHVQDMTANRANLEMRLRNSTDPSEIQDMLDDWEREYSEFGMMLGMDPTSIILDLPADDPRAALLAAFNPTAISEQYLSNMTVPMPTTVVRRMEYDGLPGLDDEGGAAGLPDIGGKQSYSQADTKISMVPLKEAKMYWLSGQGLETFKMLKDSAKNPASFEKWARDNGLGRLIEEADAWDAQYAEAQTAQQAAVSSLSTVLDKQAQARIESGESFQTTIGDKTVVMDTPLGMFGSMGVKIDAGTMWRKLYSESPQSELDLQAARQSYGEGGRLYTQYPRGAGSNKHAQDEDFRKKNYKFFIDKKKELEEEQSSLTDNRKRMVYQRVIDELDKQISGLKRDYGIREVTPDTGKKTKPKSQDAPPASVDELQAGKTRMRNLETGNIHWVDNKDVQKALDSKKYERAPL